MQSGPGCHSGVTLYRASCTRAAVSGRFVRRNLYEGCGFGVDLYGVRRTVGLLVGCGVDFGHQMAVQVPQIGALGTLNRSASGGLPAGFEALNKVSARVHALENLE
eukprot:1234719-Rhodomonas_salina.1